MKLLVFSEQTMDYNPDINGTSDAQLRPKIYYFDTIVKHYLYTAWGPKITSDGKDYLDNSVGLDVGNIYYYDDQGNYVGTLEVDEPGSADPLYILSVAVLPLEAINAGYYLAVLGQSMQGSGTLYLIIYDDSFSAVKTVNLGDMGTDISNKYMPVLHPVYFATSQGTFYLIGSGVNRTSYTNLFLYNPINDDLHFMSGYYTYGGVFSKPIVYNGDLYLMKWEGNYNYHLKLSSDNPFNSSDGGYIGNAFSFNNLVFNFVWNNKIYAVTNMLDSNGLAVKRVDLSNSSQSWETLYLDATFIPGWAGIYNGYLYIGSNTLNQPGVNNYSLEGIDSLNSGDSLQIEYQLCNNCYVSVPRFLPFSSPAGFDTLRFS